MTSLLFYYLLKLTMYPVERAIQMKPYIKRKTNDIRTVIAFFTSAKMNRIPLYLFAVLTIACIHIIQGLECGIDTGYNQREFRQMAENCIQKNTQETDKPTSEDSEEGTTQSYKNMKRNKRNDDTSNTNHQMTENTINNNTENNGITEPEKDNCAVQCVFRRMNMLDNNGFPEHNRISQTLLKNANSRELRDFIQDTTDECFQLMNQGRRQDPCMCSITLVNCLAEKGKANCADWPVGNFTFLSKN